VPELLLHRLARHAAEPPRPAFTFLRDSGPDALTYPELASAVWGLAAHLRERATPGDRAVLLLPNGPWFVIGFLATLAAGLIAVPSYPPRRNRKADRVHAIIGDCGPRLVLTTAELAAREEVAGVAAGGAELLAIDRPWSADAPPELPTDPDAVAFLQYTSGSTGAPKGVVVTHGALAANQAQIEQSFYGAGEDRARLTSVSWLPMFHDMGLVGGVLQPVHAGSHAVLLTPEDFVREPIAWLRAISRSRATRSGGPNFAYEHCARAVTAEQKRDLDLSCLEVLFCGAEPVRPETIERFSAAFAGCGFNPKAFFPCYGLAEATLFVSGGPAGRRPAKLWVAGPALEGGRVQPAVPETAGSKCLIGCGEAADGATIVAVDPATRTPVPDGRVGELWVHSPSLGRGYWNRPDETAAAFHNTLPGYPGRFLRTGDLGFVRHGEVYVTGRIKDVIVVRGRNVYPQDIEAAVAAALGLPPGCGCAAFAADADGEEQVAVVVEADREAVRALKAADEADRRVAVVRKAVTDAASCPVQAVGFVRPGAFPRTSSGKVQRQECRTQWRAGGLDLMHSWTAPPAAVPSRPVVGSGPIRRSGSGRVSGTVRPAHRSGSVNPLERRTGSGTVTLTRSVTPVGVAGRLAALVRSTLNLPPGATLAADEPLTDWGLESLTAFTLRSRIEAEFGVTLGVADLPDVWTVQVLAAAVERRRTGPAADTIEYRPAAGLAADPALWAELRAIVAGAFDQPDAVLDRVTGRNDGVHLGRDSGGRVHSFIFHRTLTATVGGREQPVVCVGLNCSRDDVRSSGATLPLYARCLGDAAKVRPAEPVLVCGVTMNPSVLAAAERALVDYHPTAGRQPDAAARGVVTALRAALGFGPAGADGPYVIREAFRPFAYTPAEARRLRGLIDRSGHPLLADLRPERCDGVLFHGWLLPRPAAHG
jgi:acyl-CoA synthetase (AMP-forming)/AMP-acid ligase II/acyl carrier protein